MRAMDPARLALIRDRLETVATAVDWADVDELREWYQRDLADLLAVVDRLTAQQAQILEVLADYDAAADKFLAKCQDGRAHSRETYADLRACRLLSQALATEGETK